MAASVATHYGELLYHAFVHTVIDDHSRVAYAEIHDDETAVAVELVLPDDGGCYRSKLWKQTCAELDVKARFTRPYRPQTNGKIDVSTAPWPPNGAFARHFQSEHARRTALPRGGCTTTITTGNTPPSAETLPSVA